MMNLTEEIPRLYTALAEWGACTIYIMSLKRKVGNGKLAVIAGFWLLLQGMLLGLTGNAPIVFWIPVMMLAVASMFFYLYTTCDIPKADIGFCCARIFVLAEFAAALEWQIYSFFVNQGMPRDNWRRNLFCLVIYGAIFLGDYLLEIRKLPHDKGLGVKSTELVSATIIALTIFMFSNISFVNINTPFSGTNLQEIFYIRTLVNLCGVLLLYSQQDERQKRQLAYEMEAINEMLLRQYNQYEMSRNNIEVLNQKYHDLKHQIIAIRQETDLEKRDHYLLEMENRIKLYESEFKTGNHVLDILLTMKSAYCTMNNINFTCVADGTVLKFMETVDICSVFGNALDNAIESVEKQEDIEKRLVKTAVYRKGQLAMIRFENYSAELPVLEQGLPDTTKKNKDYHGYGLKSIDMITRKYGGTMTINTEDSWFVLRILLPIPRQDKGKSMGNINKTANAKTYNMHKKEDSNT